MIKTLSFLLVCISLLITLSHNQALAKQNQNVSTFFSFFKDYVVGYNTIDTYNKRVLAEQTQALPTQPPQPLQPTVIQTSIPLSEVSAYILNGVNDYRKSLGLSPVQSSSQTCAFATIRAQEIENGL